MQNQMKALVKSQNPSRGCGWSMCRCPSRGPSDVLIKVKKSAICGTDVHIWKWG